MKTAAICLGLAFLLGQAAGATAAARPPVRDTDRVLVVRNENSPVSRAVADDYAQAAGRTERPFRAMPG